METIIKDGRKYKLTPIDDVSPYRLTVTKNFDFEVYPQDLPETMTYVDVVKVVEKLGDNWLIPTIEELRIMYEYKNKIGGFKTYAASGSDFPDWYWSSTEDRDCSSYVHDVRFSDGLESWLHKDNFRLSCRPVRLVASSSAPALVGN